MHSQINCITSSASLRLQHLTITVADWDRGTTDPTVSQTVIIKRHIQLRKFSNETERCALFSSKSELVFAVWLQATNNLMVGVFDRCRKIGVY